MCLRYGLHSKQLCFLSRIDKNIQFNWMYSNAKSEFSNSHYSMRHAMLLKANLQSASIPNPHGNGIHNILGVSIGKEFAGYAVLNYKTCKPTKLGVIDLQSLPNATERAAEMVGVFMILKKTLSSSSSHPTVTLTEMNQSVPSHEKFSTNLELGWIVGIEDSLRVPHTGHDVGKVSAMSKMIGIVESDCGKLFGHPSFLVNPKTARHFVGQRLNEELHSREDLFKIALQQVPNFPSIKDKHNKILSKSYFMSDAWAVAQHCKQLHETALLKSDKTFLLAIKQFVDKDKRINALRETIQSITDPEIEKELQYVLRNRISQVTDKFIENALNSRNRTPQNAN